MGAENRSSGGNATKSKKGRQRYLPHNKPVKKKGSYPLRPGVQGFFITCDGGREHQASNEAINVIDSFYDELVQGKDSDVKLAELPNKPLNKKIKFSDSESSSSDDDEEEEEGKEDKEDKNRRKTNDIEGNGKNHENQPRETEEPPTKKQCLGTDALKCVIHEKVEEKSIDKLIEAELEELGDKSKRRFFKLDSGCNGVVFIQMRKRDGDPGPNSIVQHMMTSAASTRKHMSRFILRMLPIEVACYTSEEEISRAIKPLVAQYFPVDTQNPQKFAVMFGARANSGIDRMKIINAVAKSVPGPHKVDLNNPDKTIIVEIIKTVCLIGVVEKYKEFAKYNLRQLTSPKP
ncbi:hypothetical protein SLA2020_270000 [Shorea laevis]